MLKQMEDARGRYKESICNLALRGAEVNYNFDNDTTRRQLVNTTRMVTDCSATLKEAEDRHYWALDRISVVRKHLCKHGNNVVENKGPTFWWRYQCLDCGKTAINMEEMRPNIPPGWGWGNGR
ncbi:hypothetical protein FRX31_008388 [Thalictrum thalictroides]|uniref:Uncharacterized protein n=1 Tax=Thalictrum thalictroides TaxID=46969 RepID=A0A7J6WZL8_THATH|nr:hypothetical protein FRX31_008388 [Thalictrum thalictroides]